MEILSLIITAIVSLAGGGGVGYYLTLRERKKEAGLNNKQLEENINSTIADNMIKVLDQVQEQNDDFVEQLEKKDAQIKEKDAIVEDKNKKINTLHIDLQACGSFLCLNDLCPLREPAKGLGPMIFQEMRKEGKLKGNQTPISEIAKEKGYIIDRIQCKN